MRSSGRLLLLNSLDDNELSDIIANPPNLGAEPPAPVALATPIAAEDVEVSLAPVLALVRPKQLRSFGNHGCSLPDENYAPLAAPPWLEEALIVGNEAAAQLVGQYILYKWPPRLGRRVGRRPGHFCPRRPGSSREAKPVQFCRLL